MKYFMNTSIAQFMKIALNVVVITAILFLFGYSMVDDKVTGTDGYQKTITDPAISVETPHDFTP